MLNNIRQQIHIKMWGQSKFRLELGSDDKIFLPYGVKKISHTVVVYHEL